VGQLVLIGLVRKRPCSIEAEKRRGWLSERRRGNAQTGVAVNDLNNDVPKYVTQARASYLLGMPQEELRRISEESGLGHVERAGNEEEMYFTYEELRRICQLSHPVPASH
jgi:hypothetical protein